MALRDQHVRIVEVGPRDGLQNEKSCYHCSPKWRLINALSVPLA